MYVKRVKWIAACCDKQVGFVLPPNIVEVPPMPLPMLVASVDEDDFAKSIDKSVILFFLTILSFI